MTYGHCTDLANTFPYTYWQGPMIFARVVTAGVLTFLVRKMILHRPCYTVNIARPLIASISMFLELARSNLAQTLPNPSKVIQHRLFLLNVSVVFVKCRKI